MQDPAPKRLCERPAPLQEAPLVVDRAENGTPRVTFNGMDLSMLLAVDGLQVAWSEGFDGSTPVVTLKFAPGALKVDLDLLVSAYLAAQDD